MEVVQEFRNDLLKRKEVVVENEYSGNPGEAKVTEEIAGQFKSAQENIVIKHLLSHFGSNVFRIEAFVYDSVDAKAQTEPKKKEKKK